MVLEVITFGFAFGLAIVAMMVPTFIAGFCLILAVDYINGKVKEHD